MSRQAQGLRAWLLQRLTAVYVALFSLYLIQHFWRQPVEDHAAWQAWLARPLVNLGVGLFFLALLLHAWVGVRDVIMDYVRHTGLRVALLGLLALTLAGCGLWLGRLLLTVAS
ncbi:succinate dehydrogenase, hydrophobic membrane anchor protein [Thiohalobacter sp. IOR34]|uniref:succinate dehydrogenase, hydrophobic membrane anchor protein n=1 Tax=Thiohalobacter sp. IOR34 TaxID=3057176 RepID=UPI0025AEF675|nr:succinate dehydrogenase, hydrophobic membrane anchor protein [Thiohalobacter sp. IOR34]WJW76744.1 succinate dehydrogenase, hydrophobic membrane anchor protein [Thiohalobacter sp. IOR34]